MQYYNPQNFHQPFTPDPHVQRQNCPIHGNAGNPPQVPFQMYRQIVIEDAISIAREQVPGQVVEAELKRRGGRHIYEIEVINSQGVKYEVVVEANSGEVLEVELD